MEDQIVGEGSRRQVMTRGFWGHMLLVAESLLMMLPANLRFLEGGGISQALKVSCWLGCQFIPCISGVRRLISEGFLFFPQNWAAFCCFVGVQKALFLFTLCWVGRQNTLLLSCSFRPGVKTSLASPYHLSLFFSDCLLCSLQGS